jgi:hypothetical protein
MFMPVADPEQRLAIGRDDQADVVRAEAVIVERRLDAIDVVDRQIEAVGPAEVGAVALDGLRHYRREARIPQQCPDSSNEFVIEAIGRSRFGQRLSRRRPATPEGP